MQLGLGSGGFLSDAPGGELIPLFRSADLGMESPALRGCQRPLLARAGVGHACPRPDRGAEAGRGSSVRPGGATASQGSLDPGIFRGRDPACSARAAADCGRLCSPRKFGRLRSGQPNLGHVDHKVEPGLRTQLPPVPTLFLFCIKLFSL